MGRFAVVAFKPKAGKEQTLLELTREHVPILRSQGLATDRQPYAMRAADGTIVEVFEWKSSEAIASSHENPVVLEMWGRYAQACDYVKLSSLEECNNMFADFEPIDL